MSLDYIYLSLLIGMLMNKGVKLQNSCTIRTIFFYLLLLPAINRSYLYSSYPKIIDVSHGSLLRYLGSLIINLKNFCDWDISLLIRSYALVLVFYPLLTDAHMYSLGQVAHYQLKASSKILRNLDRTSFYFLIMS